MVQGRDARAPVSTPWGGGSGDGFPLKGYGWVALLFRVILGVIFLYASFDKILHPSEFAEAIANYRILPEILINLAAVILPVLEALLGVALLVGAWIPGAVFLTNLLMLVFTCALAFNMIRGLDVHCGCFSNSAGAEARIHMGWYLVRDLLFLGMGGYLLFRVLTRSSSRR